MVRKQLTGSTIVETLIAVIIISAALATGLYSLARLDLAKSTGKRTKVELILKDYLNQTIDEERYFDETEVLERLTILKEVIETSNQNVILVKVEGMIEEEVIGMQSKVVVLNALR